MKETETRGKRGRPRTNRLLKRVNISIDPADYSSIERLAVQAGVSAALLIRTAVKQFLRDSSSQSAVLLGAVAPTTSDDSEV